METEDALFSRLKIEVKPMTTTPEESDLIARMLQSTQPNTTAIQDTQTPEIDSDISRLRTHLNPVATQSTTTDSSTDYVLNSLLTRINPKQESLEISPPDDISRFKQTQNANSFSDRNLTDESDLLLARLSPNNDDKLATARMLNSLKESQQRSQKLEAEKQALIAARNKQLADAKQKKIDAEYEQFKKEMEDQSGDKAIFLEVFNNIVSNYNGLSQARKDLVIARVEETFPSAIKKGLLGKKQLISTDYINRVFSTDQSKIEFVTVLTAID